MDSSLPPTDSSLSTTERDAPVEEKRQGSQNNPKEQDGQEK
jgi:hypothetical protein